MARPGLEPGKPRFSVVPVASRWRGEGRGSRFAGGFSATGPVPHGRGRVPLGTLAGRRPLGRAARIGDLLGAMHLRRLRAAWEIVADPLCTAVSGLIGDGVIVPVSISQTERQPAA